MLETIGGLILSRLAALVVAPDAAAALADQMRQAIAGHRFPAPVNREVTASFGVSWSPQGRPFEHAYGRADEALYEAKRGGRNRVVQALE